MLIICPTPIGNLRDVTVRQREALAGADVIACEDTRTTGKLLELLGLSRVDGKPALVSYHEHNEAARVEMLVEEIQAGKRVVLVSDAGTPGISDPGYRLVKACVSAGVLVEALPGPVAAMVALSASGLATDRFFFEGFLPSKSQARRQRLGVLDKLGVTVVLYESPHRVVATLQDIVEVCGPARALCVGRELTKKHEEYLRGPAEEVLEDLAKRPRVRGELVIVMGADVAEDADVVDPGVVDDKIRSLLEQGMRPRGIKEVVAELYDLPKSEIYERIERVKREKK